jgi:hypothetical protein
VLYLHDCFLEIENYKNILRALVTRITFEELHMRPALLEFGKKQFGVRNRAISAEFKGGINSGLALWDVVP